MPIGPGKYDDEATTVREQTDASGIILVVLEGRKGTGFSVQAPGHVLFTLPEILRALADQIDEDITPRGQG